MTLSSGLLQDLEVFLRELSIPSLKIPKRWRMQCIPGRTTFSLPLLENLSLQSEFSKYLLAFSYCSTIVFCLLVGKSPYASLRSGTKGDQSPHLHLPGSSMSLKFLGFLSTRQQTVKTAEPQASEHFAREPGEQRTDKGSTCLWVWNSLGPWIECKYTLKILLSDSVPASSGLLSWKIFRLRSFSQQKNSI